MRRLALIFVAACGGKAAAPASTVTPAPAPEPDDPRAVQLRKMTELLAMLSDQVVAITSAEPASAARCAKLTDAIDAWGEAHYDDYDEADGEGAYLGLHAADADDATLRGLAVQLAKDSSVLIDDVDQDCLYGDGAYGDALYEYLISYQGLDHWVQDGDPSVWDYEHLMASGT